MTPLSVSKEQAVRFLLRYQHLTNETALPGDDGVVDFVGKVGCIQFDPLDMVGKNHDLVLQARYSAYTKGALNRFLYEERRLFDVWDKNMAICRVEDWPYFTKNHARMAGECERFKNEIALVEAHLRRHGYACTGDMDGLDDEVFWLWTDKKRALAVLECMCYAGRAVVHHRKGTRRYFGLAEALVPRHLREISDPHTDDTVYSRWAVKRRVNSVGLMWNKNGGAFLGLQAFNAGHRNLGFKLLVEAGELASVAVEGLKTPLYVDARCTDMLLKAAPVEADNVRFLAPLDNLLWDRGLVEALTGFKYTWEVYTPAAKRTYGYYVLPVLAGTRFAGRIEMVTDKKAKALVVKNFWWEPDIKNKTAYRAAIKKALKAFAVYNLCAKVNMECKL